MAKSKTKMTVNLANLQHKLDSDTIKLVEEKIAESKGVVFGWTNDHETSGFIWSMTPEQTSLFILNILANSQEVLEIVCEGIYGGEEEEEEVDDSKPTPYIT